MRDDPMSGSRGYWDTTSYDGLNKPTTRLMQAFDLICIEDLNLRGLVKNHALARSLNDAGIDMAVRMLEEKIDKYRKRVVRIERFFPSSKMCSCCGHVVSVLPLQIREWKCAMCGAVHERDRNAANSILAVEQTVTAQGDRLRDAQPMGCESSCR